MIGVLKSVRLAAGQRVRLPPGLSPFVFLVFGHCVRLVSLLSETKGNRRETSRHSAQQEGRQDRRLEGGHNEQQ